MKFTIEHLQNLKRAKFKILDKNEFSDIVHTISKIDLDKNEISIYWNEKGPFQTIKMPIEVALLSLNKQVWKLEPIVWLVDAVEYALKHGLYTKTNGFLSGKHPDPAIEKRMRFTVLKNMREYVLDAPDHIFDVITALPCDSFIGQKWSVVTKFLNDNNIPFEQIKRSEESEKNSNKGDGIL